MNHLKRLFRRGIKGYGARRGTRFAALTALTALTALLAPGITPTGLGAETEAKAGAEPKAPYELIVPGASSDCRAAAELFGSGLKTIFGGEFTLTGQASKRRWGVSSYEFGTPETSARVAAQLARYPDLAAALTGDTGWFYQAGRIPLIGARTPAGLAAAARTLLERYAAAEFKVDPITGKSVCTGPQPQPDAQQQRQRQLDPRAVLDLAADTLARYRKITAAPGPYRIARLRPGQRIDTSSREAFLTDQAWEQAKELKIDRVLTPPKRGFLPDISLRLLHDGDYLYARYVVHDQYVRVLQTELHSLVYTDSAVELYLQPPGQERYFNFETNAGGALLLFSVFDIDAGDRFPIPAADCAAILRFASLPPKVDPELQEKTTWRLGLAIPLAFFERYAEGFRKDRVSGSVWRGNAVSCADFTSNPRQLSWQPMLGNYFHQRLFFGEFIFE